MADKGLPTALPALTKRQYYLAVNLQFTYMGAIKHLKAGEGFLDSLCRNIRGLSLPNEQEEYLMAVAIKAFGSPPQKRRKLSCQALDTLEQLPLAGKTDLTNTDKKGEQ